ncbi:MAG: DUF378 domain-containing protein [Patescibacteria group bacterium]
MNGYSGFDWLFLILLIIGGINWGLVGLFGLDLVAAIFGATILARIIYILVGISALYILFRATQRSTR